MIELHVTLFEQLFIQVFNEIDFAYKYREIPFFLVLGI